jgi:protein kinase C substrate 80K-H
MRYLFLSLIVLKGSVFVSSETLSCATGWKGEVSEIPGEWINDGYCDCPFDGRDEPGTEACSGSSEWPGLANFEAR